MNRTFSALLVVLLTALFVAFFAPAGEASSPSGSSLSYDALAKGNNAFGVQLYRVLAPSAGNLFFSPYSISSALGMTYAGARGNTAREMKEALHFPFDQAQLGGAFKRLNKQLAAAASSGGQKLDIANGLCITGGGVSKGFEALLKKDFDAELFSGGLDQINDWVSQKTQGKIRKILNQLDANSVCVLLNAIYFKGLWESRFEKSNTLDAPFIVSATKQVTAPFMYQRSDFKLLRDEDFQAISLPYRGDALSMVVLLPRKTDGLAGLEKQLTYASLEGWLGKLDRQPTRAIDLFLPKFKVRTGYDLKPPCMAMGIRQAFTENADFAGMGASKGEIWIGQIQHKAFVEVNEEGTEAAGATGVEMVTKSVRSYPLFRADHPFLFLIRDNRNSTILFMGRMENPTNK